MGCTTSKPEEGAPAVRKIQLPPTLPEVNWEIDPSWTEFLKELEQKAIEAGAHDEFCASFQEMLPKLVRGKLAEKYPECVQGGTMREMSNTSGFPTRDASPCQYPTQHVITLDDVGKGILYNQTFIIATPLRPQDEKDGQSRIVPGATLDSTEMFYTKSALVTHLALLSQQDLNIRHGVIDIYMGVDKITCKLNRNNTEPTIVPVPCTTSQEFQALTKWMVKQVKTHADEIRGMFRPYLFRMTVRTGANGPHGCTVWDEGKLPFSVNGVPYQFPTRLLVVRDYNNMTKGVEAAHFMVNAKDTTPEDKPSVLLRNLDPTKNPGGVLAITLVVAINPEVLWPKLGAYAKTAAFKAAEQALLDHVKQLNREGKVQRCDAYVSMGVDLSQHKFVGDEMPFTIPADSQSTLGRADGNKSLETDFHVTLEEQPKHTLFQSESEFQAVKEVMRQRAREDPERNRTLQMMIGPMIAKQFLEVNYPHCEITDEGEFPAVLPDGSEMQICDTRLVVARDPKQEPKSVVAAIHVVPCPDGPDGELTVLSDKVWLDTKEMKGAEFALLGLLKKWYKEGNVSEVDCMAQVMMAKDASIYKFVDGERFEDYSDERNKAFIWPGTA